jgi:3-methyladenine DNA glycosylase AlkD
MRDQEVGMHMSVEEVVAALAAQAQPDQLAGMARFGMSTEQRYGIGVPVLRKLAKQIGKDQALSRELWRTGSDEAKILAGMIGVPGEVTVEQMEEWVAEFNSWDVCDQVCMNLFEKTPHAWAKVDAWSTRDEEYVKRAAYALIACIAWHDKAAPDELFLAAFPVIRRGVTDPRNYVKKAVSWALRQIGKRNPALRAAAIDLGRELRAMDAKPARWIANDVLRELEQKPV